MQRLKEMITSVPLVLMIAGLITVYRPIFERTFVAHPMITALGLIAAHFGFSFVTDFFRNGETWKNFKTKVATLVMKWFGEDEAVVDRQSEEFKQEIRVRIKSSHIVYALLLSGYTMFFNDNIEGFILEELKKLPHEERKNKDIKIQLLKRNSTAFKIRAEEFITMMEGRDDIPFAQKVSSLDEYIGRCKNIEQELKEISNNNVEFYRREPIWRAYIFDDMAFISVYQDGVDSAFSEVLKYPRKTHDIVTPAYQGLLKHFNSLYNLCNPIQEK